MAAQVLDGKKVSAEVRAEVAARVRAERMVEKNELVREARRTSEQIIEDAERQAASIRHEAEDYIDQKLAAFEVVLERTMATVQRGREQLQAVVAPMTALEGEPVEELPNDLLDAGVFDQDDL